MIRRGKEPGRGLFCFPGGRQEFGETVAEGCVREVQEETQVEIQLLSDTMPAFTSTDVISGDYHYAILHCLCTLVPPLLEQTHLKGQLPQPIASDDALSAEWMSVRDVLALRKGTVVPFVDEVLKVAIETAESSRFARFRPKGITLE